MNLKLTIFLSLVFSGCNPFEDINAKPKQVVNDPVGKTRRVKLIKEKEVRVADWSYVDSFYEDIFGPFTSFLHFPSYRANVESFGINCAPEEVDLYNLEVLKLDQNGDPVLVNGVAQYQGFSNGQLGYGSNPPMEAGIYDRRRNCSKNHSKSPIFLSTNPVREASRVKVCDQYFYAASALNGMGTSAPFLWNAINKTFGLTIVPGSHSSVFEPLTPEPNEENIQKFYGLFFPGETLNQEELSAVLEIVAEVDEKSGCDQNPKPSACLKYKSYAYLAYAFCLNPEWQML